MSKIIELKDKNTNESIYPTIPNNLITNFKGTDLCGSFESDINKFSKDMNWCIEKIKENSRAVKSLSGLNTKATTRQLSRSITENFEISTKLDTLEKLTTEVDESKFLNKKDDLYNSESFKNTVNSIIGNHIYINNGTPQSAPIGKEIWVDDDTIYFGINGVWYSASINNYNFNIQNQTLSIQNVETSSNTVILKSTTSSVEGTKLKLN